MRPRKTLSSSEIHNLIAFLRKKHDAGELKALVKQGGLKAYKSLNSEESSYQNYYGNWLNSEGVRLFANYQSMKKYMSERTSLKIPTETYNKLVKMAESESISVDELLERLVK